MGKLTSFLYKEVARFIVKELSCYKGIEGIYLRGSVCSGDAIFWKSDIDIVILIKNFQSPDQEVKLLYRLVKQHLKIKRFLPFLGEYLIFNSQDLERWYGYSYRAHKSKGWITLYGQPININTQNLKLEEILREIVWWNTNFLFRGMINDEMRFLVNTLLMTKMLGSFLNKEIATPLISKKEIMKYCFRQNKDRADKEMYIKMQKSYLYYLWKFSKSFKGFKKFVFKECLTMLDKLASNGFLKLHEEILPGEYHTLRGFYFLPAKYYVFRLPIQEEKLNSFLDLQNSGLLVTENYLKFYLQLYDPFEYFRLKKLNKNFPVLDVSQAIERFIKKFCNKYIIRAYPFLKVYNPYYIIPLSRLYLDHRENVTSREELIEKYKKCYNSWPFKENRNLKDYFFHDYPIMWEMLVEIDERLQDIIS